MINPIDGSCLVYAGNPNRANAGGSSNGATPLTKADSNFVAGAAVQNGSPAAVQKKLKGVDMWGQMFDYVSKLPDGALKKPGIVMFPPPSTAQKPDSCLELNAVDLKLGENCGGAAKSRIENQSVGTKSYHIQLKHGQSFQFSLYFYRQPDLNADCLDFYLEKDSTRIPIKIDGITGKRINSFDDTDKKKKNGTKKQQQKEDESVLLGKLLQQNGHVLAVEFKTLDKAAIIGEGNQSWRLHLITSNKNDAACNEFDYFVDGIYIS